MTAPILERDTIEAPANPAHAVRLLCRQNRYTAPTAGLAGGYIQANLLVLPQAHAADFRSLCLRNPVPCPLLATGTATFLSSPLLTTPFDLRTDIPRYNIYSAGKLIHAGELSLADVWDETSHVAFLIGCSFSFDGALADAGLVPRHVERRCNVSMYTTTRRLNPAGVFTDATYVVSMRPYRPQDVGTVRNITRRYSEMHGEPIAWGWEALQELGIRDLSDPDFGDPVELREGEIPVFWGCGVTPQNAIMSAGDKVKGIVMAHSPGHMLVCDVREEEYFKTAYESML
ncbi:hypothetical protein BZA05DRAFT_401067 [Tricharina praecox]|uniref:uncharacterized protein n=1 Tax=Tricharina praecox TaxID=43433 RepID=UPI0022209484|nr:uncharacterized protein BZA05DRAFT_401067 [Tricharina praecox]KAI5850143.1 hypothetical protein BZA05DRAFT_401067 [Tricharina praecox]